MAGMAVGNALGTPARGRSKAEIVNEFGRLQAYHESFDLAGFVESAKDMDPGEFELQALRWVPAGVYIEDTQQALALCDCLIRDEDLSGESFAELLCKLSGPRGRGFGFGVFRGVGKSFRESIRSLEDGADWRQSGQDSASNGAAMRVAPLGIYFRDDLAKLKQRVIEQSVLTHRDAMAIAAAQAVAHVIALVAPRHTDPQARHLLDHLIEHVRAAEDLAGQQQEGMIANLQQHRNGFSTALARLADCLDLPFDEGMARIAEYAESTSDRKDVGATGGYVLSSVISAIYVFLKHRGSYERAVLAAINQGGDADTMGAIVGAMSGALHGYYSIPVRWTRGLRNLEQVKLRGAALVSHQDAREKLRPLYDMEHAICARIAVERQKHLPEEPPPIEPEPVPQEAEAGPEGDQGEPLAEDRPREPRRDRRDRPPRRDRGDRGDRGDRPRRREGDRGGRRPPRGR
jgi:ADP-ribosylglycohydrolase